MRALQKETKMLGKKQLLALRLTTLCLSLLFFSACASTPVQKVPVSQRLTAWDAQLPDGFKVQIELAQLAEKTYHTITDTPIKQLQTESGAQQLGDLITSTRDKYRQWKSYGEYYVPLPDRDICYNNGNHQFPSQGARVNFGQITYDSGTPGNKGSLLESIMDFGNDKSSPSSAGYIKSSRGKVIFIGVRGDEINWRIMEPFKDIMEGDRIADIPALIGRIKR